MEPVSATVRDQDLERMEVDQPNSSIMRDLSIETQDRVRPYIAKGSGGRTRNCKKCDAAGIQGERANNERLDE
jgi:hypothetical protein